MRKNFDSEISGTDQLIIFIDGQRNDHDREERRGDVEWSGVVK